MTAIPEHVVDRLKTVPWVDRANIDPALMPDFMIIGPQRTGTTWLYMQLEQHPDVFMCTPKEPLFFCFVPKPLTPPSFIEGVPTTLDEYLALFASEEARRAKVRGEASAHYAVPLFWFPKVIDDIVTLRPDIKCIGLVRHPIERAWSHAKLDLCKRPGKKVEDVSMEEWVGFLGTPFSRDCSRYEDVYAAWSSRLKPGNFLTLRFKDVMEQPAELLQRTHRFLGLDTGPEFVPANATKVQNQTDPDPPPPHVAALLEELFGEDLRRLQASGWV